jgi:hypothetical protein
MPDFWFAGVQESGSHPFGPLRRLTSTGLPPPRRTSVSAAGMVHTRPCSACPGPSSEAMVGHTTPRGRSSRPATVLELLLAATDADRDTRQSPRWRVACPHRAGTRHTGAGFRVWSRALPRPAYTAGTTPASRRCPTPTQDTGVPRAARTRSRPTVCPGCKEGATTAPARPGSGAAPAATRPSYRGLQATCRMGCLLLQRPYSPYPCRVLGTAAGPVRRQPARAFWILQPSRGIGLHRHWNRCGSRGGRSAASALTGKVRRVRGRGGWMSGDVRSSDRWGCGG